MEQITAYDNKELHVGDIVRFHTPYPDEDPNTIFIVLWSYYDPEGKSSRAEVVKFDQGLRYPPCYSEMVYTGFRKGSRSEPRITEAN